MNNISKTSNDVEDIEDREKKEEDDDDDDDDEEEETLQNKSLAPKDAKNEEEARADIMLLRRWNGKLLADRLNLPDMEIEIERAVEQVQTAIEQARKERMQKAEMKRVEAEIAAEERKQENWP